MFGILFFWHGWFYVTISSLRKHCVLQFLKAPIDYKKLRRNQTNKLRQAKHRAKKKEAEAVKSDVEILIADILPYGNVYPSNFLTPVIRVCQVGNVHL